MVKILPVRQDDCSEGPPVPVLVDRMNGDLLTKAQARGGLFRPLAERLLLFGTIDAGKANSFRLPGMQDFDGVTIEYGDDAA